MNNPVHLVWSTTIAAVAAILALSLVAHAASPPADSHRVGINWYAGGVDAAFAQARTQNKPLFLYWGAAWCPPCNQVKATIFKRADFIARSRFFIPVNLDGDGPGAQKIGARFKVRGYPTTILFRPDGSEITRLPGEVDAARYLKVLALGMNATHPVKETLQAALTGTPKLSADDWRLLSFYSWDTDEQALLPQVSPVATLQNLADKAPPGDAALRLHLLALVASASARTENQPGVDHSDAVKLLTRVYADANQSRNNADILTNYAGKLAEAHTAPAGAARMQLVSAGEIALARLASDTSLSTTDQLAARDAEITLVQTNNLPAALDPRLLKAAQAQVAVADQTTKDPYERQSVISAAGDVLTDAGLLDESDHLLNAELKRSHSPYYFMLGLAANAKKRGDKGSALSWYEQAYAASKGPATRLQWGTTYLNNLIELSPADELRIEKVAHSLLAELAGTPDAFYERNRIRLETTGHKLTAWKAAKHDAVFERIAAQLNGICARLPVDDGQKSTCSGLLKLG